MILSFLKLKDNKIVFIGDLEHSNTGTFQYFVKFKNKNIRIIKVQKSKM